MNAIKKYQPLLWFIGMVAGIVVFVFQSFATNEHVESVRASTIQYVDGKHENVENQIRIMQSTLERIDQRTYEIHKGMKNGNQ